MLTKVNPWYLLILAGLLEIVWALGLKSTQGFTRLWPSLGAGVAMVASIGLLTLALRHLPVGTAYAVWTGIGAVGTALIGIIWLGEAASLPRIACLTMIIAGLVGLKFWS